MVVVGNGAAQGSSTMAAQGSCGGVGELLIAEAVDDQDEVVPRVGDQLSQRGAQTSGWGPAGEADLQLCCEIHQVGAVIGDDAGLVGGQDEVALRQVHGEVLGLDERGAVDDDPVIGHPIGPCSTLHRVDRQLVIDGEEDPFTGNT